MSASTFERGVADMRAVAKRMTPPALERRVLRSIRHEELLRLGCVAVAALFLGLALLHLGRVAVAMFEMYSSGYPGRWSPRPGMALSFAEMEDSFLRSLPQALWRVLLSGLLVVAASRRDTLSRLFLLVFGVGEVVVFASRSKWMNTWEPTQGVQPWLLFEEGQLFVWLALGGLLITLTFLRGLGPDDDDFEPLRYRGALLVSMGVLMSETLNAALRCGHELGILIENPSAPWAWMTALLLGLLPFGFLAATLYGFSKLRVWSALLGFSAAAFMTAAAHLLHSSQNISRAMDMPIWWKGVAVLVCLSPLILLAISSLRSSDAPSPEE